MPKSDASSAFIIAAVAASVVAVVSVALAFDIVHVGTVVEYHANTNDIPLAESAAVVNSAFNLILAGSAFAGLIVTIAALYVLYKTFQETRALTKRTDEIGRAQTRCYISVEKIEALVTEDLVPVIKFTVHNSGNSPALICHAIVKIVYIAKVGEENRRQDARFMQPVVLGDIPSKEKSFNSLIAVQNNKLEHAEIIGGGKLHFSCKAMIFAKDVFDEEVTDYVKFSFYGKLSSSASDLKVMSKDQDRFSDIEEIHISQLRERSWRNWSEPLVAPNSVSLARRTSAPDIRDHIPYADA